MTDLYLGSKSSGINSGPKERPKLNLTVKKGMGGRIMAQSGMAKVRDNTYDFVNAFSFSVIKRRRTDV